MSEYYEDDNWSDGDDDRNEFVDDNPKKRRNKTSVSSISKLKKISTKSNKKEMYQMSDYELKIQQNIEERKKMFQMLELGDAKKDFADLLKKPKKNQRDAIDQHDDDSSLSNPKVRNTSKDYSLKKAKKSQQESVLPPRMSLRERKTKMNYAVDVSPERVDRYSQPTRKLLPSRSILEAEKPKALAMTLRAQRIRQPMLKSKSVEDSFPVPVTMDTAYVDQGSIEESKCFVEDVKCYLENEELEVKKSNVPEDLEEFLQTVRALELTEDRVARVVDKKITAFAWHPNSTNLLLAVGDNVGTIGFWDVDCPGEFQRTRCYDVHHSTVTSLSFDKFNLFRLFSTSKDGCTRLLDFRSGNFDEIFTLPMATRVDANHIQLNSSSLLVSEGDGCVLLIDLRADRNDRIMREIKCFDGSLSSLSAHPLHENIFMAAGQNGQVSVFDLRQIHPISRNCHLAEIIINLPQRSTKIQEASFSPLSGDCALTVGENVVEIFDLHGSEAKRLNSLDFSPSKIKTRVQHNSNHAMWHPSREDVFVVGSNRNESKQIEMFSAPDGQLLHTFKHDLLSQKTALNVFHPTLPILAASGSVAGSGRVHLFR